MVDLFTALEASGSLIVQPTRLNWNEDGISQINSYKADFATCLALRPEIGMLITSSTGDYPMQVKNIDITKNVGISDMVVTYNTSFVSSVESNDPTYEIIWQREDQPIENHPIFEYTGEWETGSMQLQNEDYDKIRQWEAETNPTTRQTLYNAMKDGAKKICDLKNRGVDTFMTFMPVVRETRKYFGNTRPTTGGCGKQETPPSGSQYPQTGPGGVTYKYIKMADDCIKQDRRWERRQEWIGFLRIEAQFLVG